MMLHQADTEFDRSTAVSKSREFPGDTTVGAFGQHKRSYLMSLQRHFIDWNQPLLPAVADYVIKRYADGEQLDLRNVVMVFTGARASRRMLELLYEQASPTWPAFMPPRMVTFRHFPEMLYRPKRRFAEDLTQLLIWKRAIEAIPENQLKIALPQIPARDAIPAWLALCATMQTQHNELAEEGVDFNDVAEALEKLGNRDEAKRWHEFNKLQSEYLVQVDQMGLWDRQTSRLVAVDQQECAVDFDILLIGTVDMNRVVQQMLVQVADRVTAIVHAPEAEAAGFDEFGCLQVDHWTERKLNISPEATRIAANPEEQAATVIREIAAFRASRRPDEIAIGVADDSLVPTLLQQLSTAGVSGRWPVGMQLKDSRPWRLLTGVVDHLSSARAGQPPDFATLCDLVRHPDVTQWTDERVESSFGKQSASVDWLTELDTYIAIHLQTTPGTLLGSKSRQQVVKGIISSVEELLSHLCPQDICAAETGRGATANPQQKQLFDQDSDTSARPLHHQLESRQSLTVWADGVLRLLGAIYASRELNAEDFRDRGIAECCTALTDAAAVLNRVPEDVMLKCTASQAIQFLLRETGDASIPPPPDDQAIDLLGWLELAMDDSPVLLLTGFNEGFVPESITSDVFLPNSLRTALGLRDNRRRYARDAYAVSSMMQNREKVVFIAGRADTKGNPLTPSRLWFAADSDSLPDRVRRFYDVESDVAQTSSTEAGIIDVPNDLGELQPSRLSGFTVPRPGAVPPAPAEIPVTAFREYLDCPYRYFLKRELRLRSVEDETLELAAPAFGSLIHDVLNEFGQSAYADATTVEPIETFLMQALNRLAINRFGRTRSATVAVQLQMIHNRLTAFAHWQAETCAEGWRIQHSEKELRFEEFKDSEGRSVTLLGRVDRIDQHKDTGEWRVLDYKTGEKADKPELTHSKRKGKDKVREWTDLQLPLYRLLVRSLGIHDNLQLGYVHLPGDLSKIGCSMAKWPQEDFDSAEETARQIATDIMDLKIDRVEAGTDRRATEFARVCQDTVIDRNIPWLQDWTGRT